MDQPSLAASTVKWLNVGMNAGALLVGAALAVGFTYLARKAVFRYKWAGFPTTLVVFDAIALFLMTVITSAAELWKAATWVSIDAYSIAAYFVVGGILSASIGAKALASLSREVGAAHVRNLNQKITDLERQRDVAFNLEALICEVNKMKLARLAKRSRSPTPVSLEAALAPAEQIHVLVQVLHKHIQKKLQPGFRLRIGIYMLADDKQTLEAIYGWDGTTMDCFSNNYRDYMRVSSPGGGRTLVVEAWLSPEPFHCVPNVVEANRAGRFRYLHPDQEDSLRSMIAYRHNVTGLSSEAFIFTLDSNQLDLFSADVAAECKILLPAFAKRIELEKLALAPN